MSNNPAMVERFFHYMPSEGAAGFFFALFLVVGIVNIVQTLRWARHARYVYFVAGTAVLELIGYGARLIATQRISLGVYIAMTFFLIIPPIILGTCVRCGGAGAVRRRRMVGWPARQRLRLQCGTIQHHQHHQHPHDRHPHPHHQHHPHTQPS